MLLPRFATSGVASPVLLLHLMCLQLSETDFVMNLELCYCNKASQHSRSGVAALSSGLGLLRRHLRELGRLRAGALGQQLLLLALWDLADGCLVLLVFGLLR